MVVVSKINKLKAVIVGLQNNVATLTAGNAAKEDPFGDMLIPKLKGEVGWPGGNGQARYRLRDVMGLTNEKQLYKQDNDMDDENCMTHGQIFNPQAVLFGKSEESDHGDSKDDADNIWGRDGADYHETLEQAHNRPGPRDFKTNTEAKYETDKMINQGNIPNPDIHRTTPLDHTSTVKDLLEVFVDKDGFFLDTNSTVLEMHYNPKSKTYRLTDRCPLNSPLLWCSAWAMSKLALSSSTHHVQ
ncbi:hypothetical protein JB92DRAFT_3131974 [Gautieria morchelliformis]|nr:hypothetical protein JB92DRAFT_3131974 [Gautieria morchelliformis]